MRLIFGVGSTKRGDPIPRVVPDLGPDQIVIKKNLVLNPQRNEIMFQNETFNFKWTDFAHIEVILVEIVFACLHRILMMVLALPFSSRLHDLLKDFVQPFHSSGAWLIIITHYRWRLQLAACTNLESIALGFGVAI